MLLLDELYSIWEARPEVPYVYPAIPRLTPEQKSFETRSATKAFQKTSAWHFNRALGDISFLNKDTLSAADDELKAKWEREDASIDIETGPAEAVLEQEGEEGGSDGLELSITNLLS